MTIITISRGSFSGGKMLAECLADGLGYRCIDRDAIVEKVVAAYGGSHDDVLDALEKPPTLWERFKHNKSAYLTLFQATLVEEVRHGDAVYHGNAGHLLLRGVSHVVRVRIVAPLGFRLRQVRERMSISKEEALAYVEKMDQNRARWTQYLYGVNWEDPALYDIVLNLEHLDLHEACRTVFFVARQKCFEETAQSLGALENLALESRIRASLVTNRTTADLDVRIAAESGIVTARGKVNTAQDFCEIERVASGVRGVKQLNLDEVAVYHDV
jgi:cytidylate kinase